MIGERQPDEAIEELAAAQHGVVTRAQLRALGLTKRVIDHRVAKRRLKVVHRGVYRIGPVVSPRAREIAAALACGPAAVVSHRSAAAVLQFVPAQGAEDAVDVTVPGAGRRRIEGIRAHRSHRLAADEVVRMDGVPLTSPIRTLLDLANSLGAAELERAAAQAERLDLITAPEVVAMIRANGRHPGTRALRRLFESDVPPALTRSEAESRLLELIRRARLRAPRTNVRLGGYEVDFLWVAEKLVVEVDGFAYHSSASAFARDRRRDASLTAAGFRVLRVTWPDIVDEPEATLVRIAQSLAR